MPALLLTVFLLTVYCYTQDQLYQPGSVLFVANLSYRKRGEGGKRGGEGREKGQRK